MKEDSDRYERPEITGKMLIAAMILGTKLQDAEGNPFFISANLLEIIDDIRSENPSPNSLFLLHAIGHDIKHKADLRKKVETLVSHISLVRIKDAVKSNS